MNTTFITDAKGLQHSYDEAVRQVFLNVRPVYGYPEPVLNEGGVYNGIWMEGGPHENLILGEWEPQLAFHGHKIFFDAMDEEGFIPPAITKKRHSGHLQIVVPIARTALICARRFGREDLLSLAYDACARYDGWLTANRNRMSTDLVEAVCYWDTGHDNSPRHAGQPDHCQNFDTKAYPPGAFFLAPDLSATKYGGRLALARMAELLGKDSERDQWLEKAESLRRAILEHTFDDADGMFYDRLSTGGFNRCKSDLLSRVLQEHVPDQALFEQIFARHIDNPKEFWTPYPMPSIAVDDPRFTWDFPYNCWGGASQALTALRTPLWMEHYRKFAHQRCLMEKWVEALSRTDDFRQQMNPFSGEMSTTAGYSPAMLVLADFVGRLYGVKESEDGGQMLWGCGQAPGATASRYETVLHRRRYLLDSAANRAKLFVDDRHILTVYGKARIITDPEGRLIDAIQTDVGSIAVEREGQHV